MNDRAGSSLPQIGGVSEDQIILARANGYSFHLNDETWVLDKNTKVYTSQIRALVSGETLRGCLKTLAFFSANMSAGHAHSMESHFTHFLKETNAREITSAELINYRSTLTSDKEWYLGKLRGFLKKWHQLGYEGVSDEVIEMIAGWRIKGSLKGDRVKRMDPTLGPLSDIELQAFNEGVVRAYELDQITLAELAMCLVISNTGRRPIQISHLRVGDIVRGKNNRGEPFYGINIPRAKQGTGFRTSFKVWALNQDLYSIVNAQAKSSMQQAARVLGFELQDSDREQLPLFLDPKVLSSIRSPVELRRLATTDKLHITSSKITETIQHVVESLDIHSERTGELIHLNSQRFRYSTGTRAAREGFGELVIAELMDHTDTQSSGIYIKNIPEHVERLDEAMGFQLAPYAQAFAGVLVDSERDAKRGDDPNSRIRAEEGQGIGTCGEHGFCGANVPIPCYTCMHFQPWVDGPHEEVYEELLAERERIKEMTGDMQVAAVLDRSIIAVADVISRCKKRRQELDQEKGAGDV